MCARPGGEFCLMTVGSAWDSSPGTVAACAIAAPRSRRNAPNRVRGVISIDAASGPRRAPLSGKSSISTSRIKRKSILFNVAYIGYCILTFDAVFAAGSGAVALTVIKSGSRRAAKPAHFSGTICEAQRSVFRGKYEPHKVKEIAR